MRLGLIALKNVNDVNGFEEATELTLTEGNPATLYFRLVDLDRPVRGSADHGYLRYVPAAGATMEAVLQNIDQAQVVTKVGTQPFSADDRSIWSIPILATDKVSFSNIDVTLTIGSDTYTVPVISTIVSSPVGPGRFFC